MAPSCMELGIQPTICGTKVISVTSQSNRNIGLKTNNNVFCDAAGGYVYQNITKITRNRWISWKVFDNAIKLEETSLDYNLFGNCLEINVPGETLIPNLVLKESQDHLYIFFATTQTVHQVSLTHPNHEKYGFILPTGMDVSLPSVFNNVEESLLKKQASLSQACLSFDTIMTHDKQVYYGLKSVANSLLVVHLSDDIENNQCIELKEAGVMQRLWTGLVPSFVRGDSSGLDVESVLVHAFGDDVYAFTLCKDLKIRVWDIKTQTCITTKDLVVLIPDKLDPQTDIVGALCLKKALSTSSGQLTLGAHCCLQFSSQFIMLEIFKAQKEITMMHISNFFSDFTTVLDICLTSRYVWALWKTQEEDYAVSYAPVEGGKEFERGWHTVHLNQKTNDEVFVPMFQDSKEAYVEHLFTPGSFDKRSILKALKVFTKTINQGEEFLPDEQSDLMAIRESLVQILDLEVEESMMNRDVSPSEFQDIQLQCWSKFYLFYQQCRQANEKPLGIFVDESNSLALVLRQYSFGHLYSLDWLDHLYLTDLDTCEGVCSFIDDELDLEGNSIGNDILILLECMKSISTQFVQEVLLGIDKDLDGNEDVKAFLTCMASVLITNSSDFEQLVGDPIERGDFLTEIEGRLTHLHNPQKAVEILLTALECTEFSSSSTLSHSELESPRDDDNTTQFLCSRTGVEIATEILSKLSFHRMHLCRDLFILLKFMDMISCKIGLDLSVAKDFGSPMSNSCYEMLRGFHAVYWSSKTTFQKLDSNSLDNNLTNLASLHLTERSPLSRTARKIDEETMDTTPCSLLSCFVHDFGLQNSLKYLTETNLNLMKPGDYSTIEMIKLMTKACLNEIWVLNENSSDFPEYLAGHGQYTLLNDYLHLCDDWCMVSRGTKDFLLAQSYLGNDQPEKSLRYFISAARGISREEPLLMNLLEGKEDSKQSTLVQYFIKVMRLFEQYDYPQFVIQAATSAITIATKDNPNVPMLWSVVFKYHVELEHYDEAYAAIIHNTDKIRRNDCLRHFIITLCERGLFQEICSYPYVNLEDEVVSVIEARARTMDITVNKYYDLLYSYHIIKNDYRKAATTMYEQACRLRTEMHGLKSLQKQAKCFLASLSSLKLVDKKYAWIVRPQEKLNLVANTTTRDQQSVSQSPKRKQDGEEIYYSTLKKIKPKTIIIEMNDLEKEYLLVLARLKLVQHGGSDNITLSATLTPTETIGLLSQTGLYDTAFSLAEKFKLSYKSIFEALAGKCAGLVKGKVSEFDERWKWLTLNEINTIQLVSAKTAPQQAFLLLQNFLTKYKQRTSSIHMKTVSAKFLSLGVSIPSWLVKEYEFTNPAELLHLYICYDMVNEATQLSIKYINAVLGVGKEYLGLNTALHATTPAVWLPYTSFDQLLTALRNDFENPVSAELCNELQEKMDDYFTQVEMITCDKLDYLHKKATRLL